MRRTVTSLFAFALSALIAGQAFAVDLNDNYFQTVASYYQSSYEEVFVFADEIGVTDVAVAYAITSRSKVSIDKVIELRTDGAAWQVVAADCGLNIAEFYIMISGDIASKTYGPIFAKFSSAPEFKWKELEFSDQELVDLVNLKLMSSHYDFSVFEVMAMKDIGSDWPRINQKVAISKESLLNKYAQR